jgi:hypothetical protein
MKLAGRLAMGHPATAIAAPLREMRVDAIFSYIGDMVRCQSQEKPHPRPVNGYPVSFPDPLSSRRRSISGEVGVRLNLP